MPNFVYLFVFCAFGLCVLRVDGVWIFHGCLVADGMAVDEPIIFRNGTYILRMDCHKINVSFLYPVFLIELNAGNWKPFIYLSVLLWFYCSKGIKRLQKTSDQRLVNLLHLLMCYAYVSISLWTCCMFFHKICEVKCYNTWICIASKCSVSYAHTSQESLL